MYICNICNKEFTKTSQLNGHKQTHTKSKAHNAYLNNPKACEECTSIIDWRIMRNKTSARFCSTSCRSKFSNKRRRK